MGNQLHRRRIAYAAAKRAQATLESKRNMQTRDDSLEREIAWAIVQKYRGRARQLVLIERQSKRNDCDSEAALLRLVTEDALKLDTQWARRFNF